MLALFAVCASLMYFRLLPAILAVPVMALGIAALAGVGPAGLGSILTDGSVKLAPVFAYVIFGALLSRVTMTTGIAETIVAYAAEFGGERPLALALVLSAAVAALFTSLYGLGAIIMVGSIVLPIMMTVGVPRKTAATLFLLAYSLGFIFNVSQWGFYTKTFGVERGQMQPFALALAGIDAAVLVAFAVTRFRRERGYATWAHTPDEPIARKHAPALALLTPVLPIVLYFALGVSPVVAFLLAAVYGVALTKPREAVSVLISSAIRGVEDVAPAVLLFMGIGMLLAATGFPAVRDALSPVVAAVAPRSWPGYVALFGLLSPLALYRGPLNPFGVGIGVYTVLAALGVLPAVALVAAIMSVVQVQNACDPTNTQNVWVANFTGVNVDEITRIALPFQVAVATLATLAVAFFGPALLGTAVFSPATAAAAATLPPGLFSPPAAAGTVALRATGLAVNAYEAVAREIAADAPRPAVVPLDGDPAAADCAKKSYAAALELDASIDPRPELGYILDTDLYLCDCAGWPVEEWHESQVTAAPPATAAVEQQAIKAAQRFSLWTAEHPRLAASLLRTGLAGDERGGRTYFYTLVKTIDGQMRAIVRPGGPAYAAGLRTNDIVVKLDGKFWWEYGTFQTQRRAYDGLPHTFEITRGTKSLTVTLGEPYQV
jgi:hypothetical protein